MLHRIAKAAFVLSALATAFLILIFAHFGMATTPLGNEIEVAFLMCSPLWLIALILRIIAG